MPKANYEHDLEREVSRWSPKFEKWMADNRLDTGKTFSDKRERAAAIMLAERIDGRDVAAVLDGCPHVVPTLILKWYYEKYL